MKTKGKKDIYLILMNTGTLLSKIIIKITGYKYSHVVLSLDNKYTKLFSFGRKTVYNFLNAGLVTYGLGSNFFKVYKNTDCLIYRLTITNMQYYRLKIILNKYERNAKKYKYDIKGLLFRYFNISNKTRINYYVCTMFVSHVLTEAKIYNFNKPIELVKPKDFTKIKGIDKVYEGKFNKIK